MSVSEPLRLNEHGQTMKKRHYHIPGFDTSARKGEVIGGAAAGTLLGYLSRGGSPGGSCWSLGAMVATSAALMGMLFAFYKTGARESEEKSIHDYAMDAMLTRARKRKGGRHLR